MQQKTSTCLRLLLAPVVRFCLRHSLKLQDIVETCKIVLVEQAVDELNRLLQTVSDSRLSVMTGVHRKDIARLRNNLPRKTDNTTLLTKVVGLWQGHKDFRTAAGKPRVLSFDGKTSEFAKLVHAVSSDLNPYTVLFELERLDLILRSKSRIKLKTDFLNLRGRVEEGYQLLAQDIHRLSRAVEENIQDCKSSTPHLHLRTEYDKIPARFAPELREWVLGEGSRFHARLREKLSRYDADMNPKLRTKHPQNFVRLAIGSFSFLSSPTNLEER